MQKTGKYQEGLKVCREVYQDYPDFASIKNTYAWCIYYTEIKQDEITDEEKFLKAAQAITMLTVQDDKFSPYTITCFRVIDYLYDKPNYNIEKISEWLNKLEPDKLSEEVKRVSTSDEKERELASDREKWYKIKSDILLEKENYQECIELSSKALMIFTKFHYGNDVWLKRNIALSHFGMKNYDKALELLLDIHLKKSEWYIEKDISEILYAQKKKDGDFDLVIGKSDGTIVYFENKGNPLVPNFVRNDTLFAGVRTKQNAHPGFADLDGDSRKDLVLGEYDGNFTFFKNLFAVPLSVENVLSRISDFNLYQNYPNPFNSKTKIRFTVASTDLNSTKGEIITTLKVYDLLGREIATLVNEPKQAGEYEVEFDADKYGLTSGVYLYELRSGSFKSAKKFVMIK